MKYRKKPIVIEAIQFTGINTGEMVRWDECIFSLAMLGKRQLQIQTIFGNIIANPGDWVIKDVSGEVYSIKPDIFEKTYEKVEE